jgi:TonB family protein
VTGVDPGSARRDHRDISRALRVNISVHLNWLASASARRFTAVVIAVGVNLTLAALLGTRAELRGATVEDERLEVYVYTLASAPRIERPRPDAEESPAARRRSAREPALSTAAAVSTPPTETIAQRGYALNDPDHPLDVPTANLSRLCKDSGHQHFGNADGGATIMLRVFVMPDGRIAQGSIDRSSGDADFDRAALTCLQTYANLTPMIIEGNPVGSWQTVETRWMR